MRGFRWFYFIFNRVNINDIKIPIFDAGSELRWEPASKIRNEKKLKLTELKIKQVLRRPRMVLMEPLQERGIFWSQPMCMMWRVEDPTRQIDPSHDTRRIRPMRYARPISYLQRLSLHVSPPRSHLGIPVLVANILLLGGSDPGGPPFYHLVKITLVT